MSVPDATNTPSESMELTDPSKSSAFALNPTFFGVDPSETTPHQHPQTPSSPNTLQLFTQVREFYEKSQSSSISSFSRLDSSLSALRAAEELLLDVGFNPVLTAVLESPSFSLADVLGAVQRLLEDLSFLPTTPRYLAYLQTQLAEVARVLTSLLAKEDLVKTAISDNKL